MSVPRKHSEVEQPQQPQYSTLREYFVTTVICTVLALFVTTYVLHPMTVPTPSMVPTIMVGDRLIIDKFTVRNGLHATLPFTPARRIQRGDVIVFKFPQNPEVLYVKRAIGLPNDRFEVRDKGVYINGQLLPEKYKYHSDPTIFSSAAGFHFFSGDFRRDNVAPFVIPPHQYFMMGDNRDDSADSRYWGTLTEDLIVGRPLVVFWSYEDDSDAYLKTGAGDVVKLYGSRLLFFITKTRWARIGRLIR